MNYICYRITGFVFLCVIIFWSSVLASEDSTLFNCLAPDSIQSPAALAGERTLSPVAIYACHTNASTIRLPDWYDDIWDSTVGLSVPGFYRDNSLGKYRMNSAAFGRNDTLCFTFTGASADGALAADKALGYFDEVMPLADTLAGINFADFDNDGPNGVPASRDTFHIITESGDTVIGDDDGAVDGLFFIIVNHTGPAGISRSNPNDADFTYRTRDTAIDGDTILVPNNLVVVVKANDKERVINIASHEWGHVLGIGDFNGNGSGATVLPAVGWWGLGSFSIMGAGWPSFRAVPFDPWSRIQLQWDTAIVVNTSLIGRQIRDYLTTGEIYKLPKDSMEYFLVTNHKGVNPDVDTAGRWEGKMLGTRGGLMIWHVKIPGGNAREEKLVDCELAQGLHNYLADYSNWTGANAASGKDSLDFLVKTSCGSACTTWVGFNPPNIASARCYWNDSTKIEFDGLSNPNSDAYSDSIDEVTEMRVQNIPTRLAARNIHKNIQSFATADLLVNNWGGNITQNSTWSGTVLITENVSVNAGITLTVSPGTVIKVSGGKKFIVYGTLTSVGTLEDSIILTSSATSPANGDWGGVLFNYPGRGYLEHVRISYADTAISVQGDTATVIVYNSTFTHFNTVAVYSKSAKTRLGGLKYQSVPPDCGRNNFLMNTATFGAKAVIKSTTPSDTLKAEGNWWTQTPPSSSWFSGNNVDRTPYLLGYATPDSCNTGGEGPEPPPEERIAVRSTLPTTFELGQNYPNPFNPTTSIRYALPQPARVELRIFNMLGQMVRKLVNEEKPAGFHEAVWDGRDETGRPVSTGIYLYRIKAGDFMETKRMSLIK